MKTVLKKGAAILLALALLLPAGIFPAAATYLLGDVNRDGFIGADDARLALRMSVELEKAGAAETACGDADGDGSLTAIDARLILRCSVGLTGFGGKKVTVSDPSSGPAPADPVLTVPAAPAVNAPHGTFTFVKYGNGHGVGMSQYGAIGMADAGYTYKQILTHYYANSKVVRAASWPSATWYAGSHIDTEELLARIVYQEISGATQNPEALKAQAVAVFTLLKRDGFRVTSPGSVGYAGPSYAACSAVLKKAVRECVGEYMAMANDSACKPILTVYSAMVAGRTVNCSDAWGGDYPVSVDSPYDATFPNFISFYTITTSTLRDYIRDYSSSITLSSDPADWLEILSHNASLDAGRGYVTKIRVGDCVLTGAQFKSLLDLSTGCFTVVYTP